MSESDSFIQEVTDEVRQDRMFRLWKKYGPYAVTGVVGIVAISAGFNWMEHRERETARETGGAFLATQSGAGEDLEVLVGSVAGRPAAVVAELRLAAAQAAAGETGAAVELYREIAVQPGLERAYADLALLQAVRIGAAAMDPTQAVAELNGLVAEDAPYRLLALELRAIIRLNAGETDSAHDDLRELLADPAATRDLLNRVSALLLSSGGTPQASEQ